MSVDTKQRYCFPLRLSSTMRRQANDLAHSEGLSLNHFISLAVAEKISRMEHSSWLKEQARPSQEPMTSSLFRRRP
ncbi:hypothetical protein [Silvibacterium dinghuense]|uniref:Toxin-antitoxin system HicB family antitoxin n=1 Tax=Silvibacterium dinghuense TaxID=1560006 RepID=A0A4Q1S9C4_9BACT|nr:hypothetical protein [Silvibacterium dinghuense]RXS93628.1 hypothetical protein ESZ00_16290 [Silvibacterium dinghuense]